MAGDWNKDSFEKVRLSKLAELCPPPKPLDLNAWFKELYSDDISALIPDGVKLMNKIQKKK